MPRLPLATQWYDRFRPPAVTCGLYCLFPQNLAQMRDHRSIAMDKPFHLLTPQEKTVLRIAQNRAITEKTKGMVAVPSKRPASKATSTVSNPNDFTRATPEDHLGSVIRKVKA